ncbi:magnesium and cobalt transport protein CorA [Promicromonospora thailandica]|uniref:Magnesium transporter n=1 Tax=Promicromonospora thailandica TaxID=765201 RepID=A0A9X2JX20_9MICO|nr:magnesium and cobalt transport protein CorA [Promicromonospora thailandica]MCP2267225.1 magnesium transporter [Promicromonospora thailandica]BFF17466.1 magnesium and cobalt transport protein CorA [Promicromonospora thailandica]
MPPRTRYVTDGRLSAGPPEESAAEALRFAQAGPGRTAVLLYPEPTAQDVEELAEAWGLHPVLAADLRDGGQRPKIERYGDVVFLVARSAWYVDETEDVHFAEFHLLLRPQAVAILCQDGRWIDGADASTAADVVDRGDHALLGDENLLDLGPEAVAYRLLDAVVDGYDPVLQGLAEDKDQIEAQVFSGDAAATERIYRLSHEVVELQHATTSLADVLDGLRRGSARHGIAKPLRKYLQHVADHLTRAVTEVTELRAALGRILDVNATLVAQRQNEDMKKISGWAAILFAPTLIGAIYGMNFDHMPELHWTFGYPLAVGAMVVFSVVLWVVFRRRGWM